ncbi:MAG TPA: hypothetical protein VKB68_05985 [Stellaceae bacterium]|nr:hypothetical protein [Stellaceae bacterium]
MSSTPARTSKRRSHLLRTLALSLAAFAIVGVSNITPANAWYDAYGYWHPSYHHYYYHHAYWRHRWWCEHHPYACGYRPYYGYSGGYYGGYYNGY